MPKALHLFILAAGAASLGAASVAIAGSSRAADDLYVAPVAEHVTATEAGYELMVHPGFASNVSIENATGVTQLYQQSETYDLPSGRTAGPEQHVIRLSGGEIGRDIGLLVNDPNHHIARITVELYGPDHTPGTAGPIVEKMVVTNHPFTCPPWCK